MAGFWRYQPAITPIYTVLIQLYSRRSTVNYRYILKTFYLIQSCYYRNYELPVIPVPFLPLRAQSNRTACEGDTKPAPFTNHCAACLELIFLRIPRQLVKWSLDGDCRALSLASYSIMCFVVQVNVCHKHIYPKALELREKKRGGGASSFELKKMILVRGIKHVIVPFKCFQALVLPACPWSAAGKLVSYLFIYFQLRKNIFAHQLGNSR